MSQALIDDPAAAQERARVEVPVRACRRRRCRSPRRRRTPRGTGRRKVLCRRRARSPQVLRAVDGPRAGELLGARGELPDEARRDGSVCRTAEPVDAVHHGRQRRRLRVRDHAGVPDGDVRAAGPDRRRPREDLVARVRVHGEQRPPLDLGVPRRPVRVGPPLERRTARVGGVARGVRLRATCGNRSALPDATAGTAAPPSASTPTRRLSTRRRSIAGRSFQGRAHTPGSPRRATGTLRHDGDCRGRAGRVDHRGAPRCDLSGGGRNAWSERHPNGSARRGAVRARVPSDGPGAVAAVRRAWPARAPAAPPPTRRPSPPPSRRRRRRAGPTAGSRARRPPPASPR